MKVAKIANTLYPEPLAHKGPPSVVSEITEPEITEPENHTMPVFTQT